MKSISTEGDEFILLAIRPEFVNKILIGEKTVELRRRLPQRACGRTLLIYETLPVGELAGLAYVEAVEQLPLEILWAKSRRKACVSRDQFDDYFAGARMGVGIFISNAVRLARPVPLWRLRQLWPGFHPPQAHRYLDRRQIGDLALPEVPAAKIRRAA